VRAGVICGVPFLIAAMSVASGRAGQGPGGGPAAQWPRSGAGGVLKLRARHSNGDFDAYGEWHLDQEQLHVHYARYQDPSALAA
jgi:hypothetical protein